MNMTIPLAYNLRNLAVRRTTTLMTVVGIALTVAVLMASLALINGLRGAFRSTGNLLNILVLRKGSNAELSSSIPRQIYQNLIFKRGIAHTPNGTSPIVSAEIVTTISLPRLGKTSGMNVTLRGLLPAGIELRNLKLREGRWFRAGLREIVVGKFIAQRCLNAHPGGQLQFGKKDWEVVGIMDGEGSVPDSEIFGDLNQIGSNFNRSDILNSILLRAEEAAIVPALLDSLANDQRLNVTAQTETAYYDRQTASGAPLQALGLFVSLIMAIGSIFGAMNTMFAAVVRRTKEIGTLRVLGFLRSSILTSFMIESILLALSGGFLGCLLVLPLNRVTTGVGNLATASETTFYFHIDYFVVGTGLLFSLLMGALGGLFPARMAANKEILAALKEV
jgi:putative ABC transport system permease protein